MAGLAEKSHSRSILDYGCGKRTLEAGLLRQWKNVPLVPIVNYDPCIEGCEKKVKCDLVACTDVLEHIEPELLDNVLADIREHMGHVGFLTVHTGPAMKHLADGRNAHLIQEGYVWWFNKLSRYFWIAHLDNMGNDLFFTVARDENVTKGKPTKMVELKGNDTVW